LGDETQNKRKSEREKEKEKKMGGGGGEGERTGTRRKRWRQSSRQDCLHYKAGLKEEKRSIFPILDFSPSVPLSFPSAHAAPNTLPDIMMLVPHGGASS
jgi:hypothetical protein